MQISRSINKLTKIPHINKLVKNSLHMNSMGKRKDTSAAKTKTALSALIKTKKFFFR